MPEENIKEILTKDIIKNEIRNISKFTIIHTTIELGALCSLFILLLFLNMGNDFVVKLLLLGWTGLVIAFLKCWLIYILVYSIKAYKATQNDGVNILVEKLVDIKNNIPDGADIRIKARFNPFFASLFFESGNRYSIPRGINYGWSKKYSMDNRGVFRASKIGDEFYLAVIGNKKVLLAYNTKFFELRD